MKEPVDPKIIKKVFSPATTSKLTSEIRSLIQKDERKLAGEESKRPGEYIPPKKPQDATPKVQAISPESATEDPSQKFQQELKDFIEAKVSISAKLG